jgi:hypothetical protein
MLLIHKVRLYEINKVLRFLLINDHLASLEMPYHFKICHSCNEGKAEDDDPIQLSKNFENTCLQIHPNNLRTSFKRTQKSQEKYYTI